MADLPVAATGHAIRQALRRRAFPELRRDEDVKRRIQDEVRSAYAKVKPSKEVGGRVMATKPRAFRLWGRTKEPQMAVGHHFVLSTCGRVGFVVGTSNLQRVVITTLTRAQSVTEPE